jgi:hypothetical protein
MPVRDAFRWTEGTRPPAASGDPNHANHLDRSDERRAWIDIRKIVECNCFNGSRFYSADVEPVVRTVSEHQERATSIMPTSAQSGAGADGRVAPAAQRKVVGLVPVTR